MPNEVNVRQQAQLCFGSRLKAKAGSTQGCEEPGHDVTRSGSARGGAVQPRQAATGKLLISPECPRAGGHLYRSIINPPAAASLLTLARITTWHYKPTPQEPQADKEFFFSFFSEVAIFSRDTPVLILPI